MKRWISLLIVLLLVGCSKVYMSPAYKKNAVEISHVISALNDDCQDGNDVACREGLRIADQWIEGLIDAVEGKADE